MPTIRHDLVRGNPWRTFWILSGFLLVVGPGCFFLPDLRDTAIWVSLSLWELEIACILFAGLLSTRKLAALQGLSIEVDDDEMRALRGEELLLAAHGRSSAVLKLSRAKALGSMESLCLRFLDETECFSTRRLFLEPETSRRLLVPRC